MPFRVGYDVLKKAFWAWWRVKERGSWNLVQKDFFEFTGVYGFLMTNDHLTDEQVHRIKLMAGPHGETLIKAWLIQQEEENDRSKNTGC